jgi:hypothetical protein
MGNPKKAADLAKKFEPILLFHPDEQFFPIDPKWYLERCALWRATPDLANRFDDKNNWGDPPFFPRAPQLAKNAIAALAAETSGGRTWIGVSKDYGVITAPDLQHDPPPSDQKFLEFVGWEVPPPTPALEEVTATSIDRHAAFTPANYATPLIGSRPWYYVEYLDNTDLTQYIQNPDLHANGPALSNLILKNMTFSGPQALLFHLFYPAHQEQLEGCAAAGEGNLFATYAGEWACVALLLDSADTPLFIGLTSRNTGKPALVGLQDQRVGMTAFLWTEAQHVGNNPKIFVSLGTHSNYLGSDPATPGSPLHPVTPFSPPTPTDPSQYSCGDVEKLDDVISGDLITPGDPPSGPDEWISIAKALDFPAGLIAATIEIFTTDWGTPDTYATPNPPTVVTGGPTSKIICTKGLTFAETTGAPTVTDWDVTPYTTSAPDGRAYGFVVDRTKQVWWAPRPASLPGARGFSGRWGPRATHDPNSRRAGMKCPDFLLMFLEAVAGKLTS